MTAAPAPTAPTLLLTSSRAAFEHGGVLELALATPDDGTDGQGLAVPGALRLCALGGDAPGRLVGLLGDHPGGRLHLVEVLRRPRVVESVELPQSPHQAAASPDGRWLAVTHLDGVELLDLTRPGEVAHWQRSTSRSARTPLEALAAPAWLDDDHLLVCDPSSDQVHVLAVGGPEDGLQQLAEVNLPEGTGPCALLVRPSTPWELHLLVAGQDSGEVVGVRHEGTDWSQGWWVGQQVLATSSPGQSRPSAMRLFGEDVVVANRGTDTVALLGWREDGTVQLVEEAPCGGHEPVDLLEHGGLLLVANRASDAVAVLAHGAEGFQVVSTRRVPAPSSLLAMHG